MGCFGSICVDVANKLDTPGDSIQLDDHVDIASYEVGEKLLKTPQGVEYHVTLTNAGNGILATGLVQACVLGTCDRCLDEASFDVAGEVEEFYLFEEPQDPESYEDGYELVSEDKHIDLGEALSDAILMDTPFVVLCKQDCKGLCPECGANKNHVDCGCAKAAEQDRFDSPENPFAALKDLKLE